MYCHFILNKRDLLDNKKKHHLGQFRSLYLNLSLQLLNLFRINFNVLCSDKYPLYEDLIHMMYLNYIKPFRDHPELNTTFLTEDVLKLIERYWD